MPREIAAWNGKPLAPPPAVVRPALIAPVPEIPSAGAASPAHPGCPRCGIGTLRLLASGALGCSGCAAIFQPHHPEPPPIPEPEPERALDQIDAINAMLRRNALVLGPGGVPLAESGTQSRGSRRRQGTSRRT